MRRQPRGITLTIACMSRTHPRFEAGVVLPLLGFTLFQISREGLAWNLAIITMSYFTANQKRIADLAKKYHLPAIHSLGDRVDRAGLRSRSSRTLRAHCVGSRTRAAPTPTNISTKSEPEMLKNGTRASPATARASSVLPVPGGPTNNTPFGKWPPSR